MGEFQVSKKYFNLTGRIDESAVTFMRCKHELCQDSAGQRPCLKTEAKSNRIVTDDSLTAYSDDDDDDAGGGDVAREAWKKRYYDEKKKTTPKEEQCTKLRNELEQWHRRIAAQLEAARDTGKRIAGHGAHEQAEMKIRSTKYEQEIEEMHTKLQNIKLRLTTEIKVIDILKSISIDQLQLYNSTLQNIAP